MNTTKLTIETSRHDCTQDIDRLYTRYRNFVARVCSRYVQNPEEAEDLTQEVFLKAGNALEAFAGQSQPSTWLYRIAVNHCLDNLRQKKRQRDLMAAYAIDAGNNTREEEGAISSTMGHVLELLREEMDPVDTQVVYLRFELDLTHEAIAEIRGVSRVAITRRLARIQRRALELHTGLEKPAALRAAA